MRLTPFRFMIFRSFNLTLGRIGTCSRVLRAWLTRRMILRARRPYTQCAGFFEFDQLDNSPLERERR